MSLNSLASTRVAREAEARANVRILSSSSEDAVGPREDDVQNALSALVEYVPAETITLYIATVSSLPVLTAAVPALNALTVYIVFAALTPALFALVYAGKRRAAGESRWPGWRAWPWWPTVAATVAFLAWGLAVPDGPFSTTDSGRVLGSLVAIFVSTLLGVFGRFFTPKTT
ncbi:MAG TPA: hypothetical protein VMO26_01405 [Vicinamibacterales bacterium]|nr:hypothetical protein [Vicinamibacterales bacterium]